MKVNRFWLAPAIVLSAWAAWTYALLNSEKYLTGVVGSSTDRLGALGSFGDSFGPIASLMATVAAAGALYAFVNDRKDRNLAQFETNFFALIGNFESITRQSKVTFGYEDTNDTNFSCDYSVLETTAFWRPMREFTGREALRIIVYLIRDEAKIEGYDDIKIVSSSYHTYFNKYVDVLGHYFRTLHHIYRLIDEKCPGDKAYYARLVRAGISNEEICLIAYNCIVGEGRIKFGKLAVKYSLFHNLHRDTLDDYQAAELGFFIRKLPSIAFRFEANPPITYDD